MGLGLRLGLGCVELGLRPGLSLGLKPGPAVLGWGWGCPGLPWAGLCWAGTGAGAGAEAEAEAVLG